MTVHTRDGRIIIDTIWPDGKRTRRQAVSPKQANDLDIRIRASRIDGTWRELRRTLNMEHAEGMTLREAADIYLDQYVRTKNRDQRGKKSRFRLLCDGMGGSELLSEVTHSDVSKYAARRVKDGASTATVNRDLAALRHLFVWAKKNDLVNANPMEEWERLSEAPYEHEKPTDDVIDAVFAKLNPTVRPLFDFLRHTGVRREEALSLKWSQVDLRNRAVHLHRTKSNKSRTVPLTIEAVSAIQAMPRTSKTEYVFYHPQSLTRWDEAKSPWIKARTAAAYTWLRVHDLRHAYAIKLAEAGVPMHFISEILGHSSVDFTRKKYAKFSPESASRAVLAVLEGGRGETGKKVAIAKIRGKR